jgi:mitochondrial import inner membrane translocase subunit TIM8
MQDPTQANQLKRVIDEENMRLQIQTQLTNLTDKCWETCMKDSSVTRMSTKEKACFSHCAHRFYDVHRLVKMRMYGMSEEEAAQQMM